MHCRNTTVITPGTCTFKAGAGKVYSAYLLMEWISLKKSGGFQEKTRHGRESWFFPKLGCSSFVEWGKKC
jgi:hypothetical protein